MKRDEVFQKMNRVFREVFNDDGIVLSEATTANDIDDWDSLMNITLVSEIEDAFEIRFEMRDVFKMHNAGEMADKILELTQ